MMQLAKEILLNFALYVARYWPLLIVLIVLHVVFALWSREDEADPEPVVATTNASVLEHFFCRGYEVEKVIFQGRLGAEYILTRLGTRICVHIKWWSKAVGANPVEALLAAKRRHDCDFAILISKEGFSWSGRQAAVRAGILLWDIEKVGKEVARIPKGVEAMGIAAAAKSK